MKDWDKTDDKKPKKMYRVLNLAYLVLSLM